MDRLTQSHQRQPASQRRVAAVAGRYRLRLTLPTALLNLTSEVGESAKALLEGDAYGRPTGGLARVSASFPDELGDVLFSWIQVANAAGSDTAVPPPECIRTTHPG